MSTGASLKFTTNLNSCASSDADGSRFLIDEKIDDEDCKSRSPDGGPPGSRHNVAENSSRKRSGLLSVKIPTGTKAQKRRHIQTNFDDSLLLNQSAIDAQRKEKERLERLERQKQLVGDSDHIQQVASVTQKPVTPLPVLDAFDPEIICLIGDGSSDDSKKRVPAYNNSTSAAGVKPEPEVIELSSGDEDDSSDTKGSSSFAPYRIVPPIPRSYEYDRRPKWLYADKDREKMEMQQKIEKERMRKRRNSHDLEKIELTQTGRLLVNAGHGADEPDVHVSAYLTHILQPHQLGGVRFMYDNIIESLSEFDKSPGFGCILAHSMGLGKTIQVITFVEVFLRVTPAKRVTVIVPINTIQNWYNEFEKWLPRYSDVGQSCRQFEVFLLGDTVKTYDQRINMIEEWTKKGGVLLIGYEMFRLLIRSTLPKKSSKSKASASNASLVDQYEKVDEQEFTAEGRVKKEANDIIRAALISPGPDLVVCDEGHKIKNLNTDIASALGAIKTRRRVVLTGYPLQNNLMEYYCMVDFVRPDFLGSKKTFSIQFEKPIKNGQCIDSTAKDIKIARQRIHVLNNMLKGFIQRRTHHLLKAILPESKEFVLLLRKSPLQHALYRNFVMYANAEISTGNTSTFNPLKAFAACSKIWNHPDILAKTLEKRREERKKTQQKDAGQQTCDGSNAFATQPSSANSASNHWPPSHLNPTTSSAMSHGTYSMAMNQSDSCVAVPGPSYASSNANNAWNSPFTKNNHHPAPSTATPSIMEALKISSSEPAQITHRDLWSGIFATGPPSSLTDNTGDSAQDDEQARSGKGKRNVRNKPKTIQGVMEEEFDIAENDQGLQYDWAEIAMGSYKVGHIEHGYKIVLALELLDACIKKGEKMLIFSQNLTALDLIESYLARRTLNTPTESTAWMKTINYFRLDGSTPGSEREKLINRFNSDPTVHLFLISTRAGSLGINLVSASRCVILDACWNPCHDAQAVCRVYRYGQQRRTYIYRLILNNCMEKAIFNRQISKHGLQQRVVDDAQVDANITQKELETLLMYDESLDVVHNKWDTSQWNLGDEVLESVVKERSEMLAEEPFLHESLMLEREEGLSEEEKKEAELWFTREQFKETILFPNDVDINDFPGRHGQGHPRGHRQVSGGFMPPQYFNSPMNFAPLRPTPIPSIIDRVHGYPNSAEGGYQMAPGFNGGLLMRNQVNHPMDQPRRVLPFPGAAVAYEPSSNSSGCVQLIRTDRDLCLPIVSHSSERREVPRNTQVMLVRNADGVFLRLSNGLLLDAQNSVFNSASNGLPPVITIPPDPPQPQPMPHLPKNNIPDVIELD
ncbi:hypothetical protein Q1695_006870 [Nippostrongylus brasiliensis]|nr:hypothetical protein Q1695_006870 [Nippostrongylus brasiliensis]